MIETGLPYDINQMEIINNEGAIVDMSNINFPQISAEEQINVSLIYLRNTNFNVKLNFENCSYEDKKEYLIKYITNNINIDYEEFSLTWLKILLFFVEYDFNLDPDLLNIFSILTDEEIKQFISEENIIMEELYQLIISLSVYVLFKSTMNGEVYDLSDIEKTDKNIIGINIYHLLYPEIDTIISSEKFDTKFLFYNKIFTINNKELFDAIDNLFVAKLLYGMSTIDPVEFKDILEEVNKEFVEDIKNE
jgi:hypothetical protein